MKFFVATAILVLSLSSTDTNSKELPSKAAISNFQTQLNNCIAKIWRNAEKPLPTGEMILTFELERGGQIKKLRVLRGGNLLNLGMSRLLLNGIPACSPFKTSIVGRITFPIMMR